MSFLLERKHNKKIFLLRYCFILLWFLRILAPAKTVPAKTQQIAAQKKKQESSSSEDSSDEEQAPVKTTANVKAANGMMTCVNIFNLIIMI